MMFHVVLKKDEEDWIVAECPALPGCFSQGKTEQEALTNIKEAITAWLWADDEKAAAAPPSDQAPWSSRYSTISTYPAAIHTLTAL